ncbi:MAG: arginine--tRNA ligase [Tissierellia bacterium]|nr:arginine--tRNA ligase [Tissierellia bacterium]
MFDYRDYIAKILKENLPDLEENELKNMIEIPPNSEMGDYAFPTFSLAKVLRKNPALIAKEIKEKIKSDKFSKIEVKGPYLNFFLDQKIFAKEVLETLLKEGADYGKSDLGEGKKVVVEFSSPNIAKPFHIGHIRTTIIGNAINNIYRFLGYDVIADNHLGDYGTQFGMLITGMKHWGDEEIIKKDPIPELLKLYVKVNKAAKEKPELADEARMWFTKLENKDEEAVRLWEFFVKESMKEFQRVYELLDIKFDTYLGESFFSDKMEDVVNELEDKNLLIESQGASIVELEEYDLPPAMILKSDGSTLYATRDLATAIYRHKVYDFYKNIYVVGSEQNLYFRQLFAVLDKMGKDWAKDCVHVPFGMVNLKEGRLSTREGKVVFLEDVLNKAKEGIKEVMLSKDRGLTESEIEELSAQIGVGAVIFQELFNDRIKDYTFDWEKTLSFEGETGPYVQYTHARIASLLEKGDFETDLDFDFSLLDLDIERDILNLIYRYPESIFDAHEKYQPYFITRHIVEIAKTFNSYYNSVPINVEDDKLKNARLALCYAAKSTIKSGLKLLGIKAPDRM